MKQDMAWHREYLRNRISHSQRSRDAALKILLQIDQDDLENQFYSDQINEAERRGLKSFDRDRLLKRISK